MVSAIERLLPEVGDAIGSRRGYCIVSMTIGVGDEDLEADVDVDVGLVGDEALAGLPTVEKDVVAPASSIEPSSELDTVSLHGLKPSCRGRDVETEMGAGTTLSYADTP